MSFPKAPHQRMGPLSSSSASAASRVSTTNALTSTTTTTPQSQSQSQPRRQSSISSSSSRPHSSHRSTGPVIETPSQRSTRRQSELQQQRQQQPTHGYRRPPPLPLTVHGDENWNVDGVSDVGSIDRNSQLRPQEDNEFLLQKTPAPSVDNGKLLENYRRLKFICRSQAEYISELEEKQQEFIQIAKKELSSDQVDMEEIDQNSRWKSIEHWRENFEMATKRAEVAEQQYEDALKQINSLKDALFNYEVDQNLHGSENSNKDQGRESRRPSTIVPSENGFQEMQPAHYNTQDVDYLRQQLEEASRAIQDRDVAMSELRADIMEEVMRLKENKEAQYKFSILESESGNIDDPSSSKRVYKKGSYLTALREQLLQLRQLMASRERIANEEKLALENQLLHANQAASQREDKLKSEVRELQEQVEALSRDAVEGTAAEAKKLKTKCKRLEERLQEALHSQKEAETLRVQDIEKLEKEIVERDQTAKSRKAIMETLREAMADVCQSRQQLEEKLGEQFSQYSQRMTEILEKLSGSSEEQWKTVSASIESLNEVLTSIKERQDETGRILEKYSSGFETGLNESFQSYSDKQNRLWKAVNDVKNHFFALDADRKDSQRKDKEHMTELERKNDEVNAEIKTLSNQLRESEQRNLHIVADRDQIVKKLQETNQDLTAKLHNAQKELLDCKEGQTNTVVSESEKLQELGSRHSELQRQLLSRVKESENHAASLQSKLNQEQEKREKAVETAEKKWSAQYESLKQQKEEAYNDLEALQTEKEEADRRAESRIQDLQGDVETLKSKLREEKQRVDREKKNSEALQHSLQSRIEDLQEDNNMLRERVTQLSNFLATDTENMTHCASQQMDLQRESQEIHENLSKHAHSMSSSLRQLQNDAENFRQMWSSELQSWMDYVSRLEKHVEETEGANARERETLRNVIENTEMRSKSLSTVIDSGEHTIDAFKHTAEELVETQKQVIDDISSTKDSAMELIESKLSPVRYDVQQSLSLNADNVNTWEQRINEAVKNWEEDRKRFEEQRKILDEQSEHELQSLRSRVNLQEQEVDKAKKEAKQVGETADQNEKLAAQELERLRAQLRQVRQETLQRERSLEEKEQMLLDELSKRKEEKETNENELQARVARERRNWEKNFDDREKTYKRELANTRAELHRILEASREKQTIYDKDYESMKREIEILRKADEQRQTLAEEERQITEELLQKLQNHANSVAVAASRPKIAQDSDTANLLEFHKQHSSQLNYEY